MKKNFRDDALHLVLSYLHDRPDIEPAIQAQLAALIDQLNQEHRDEKEWSKPRLKSGAAPAAPELNQPLVVDIPTDEPHVEPSVAPPGQPAPQPDPASGRGTLDTKLQRQAEAAAKDPALQAKIDAAKADAAAKK